MGTKKFPQGVNRRLTAEGGSGLPFFSGGGWQWVVEMTDKPPGGDENCPGFGVMRVG